MQSSSKSRYPRITPQYKEYLQWCHDQGLDEHSSAVLSFEDYSARVIQSWWRRLAPLRTKPNVIESTAENMGMEIERSLKVWDEETAAVGIQRVWRRYNVGLFLFRFTLVCINI